MSEVKVDTISERTAAGGVTIDGVLVKDGTATFQTAAGSPLVFEGATADAYETTFAITDPTADRTITFPDSSFTVPTSGGLTNASTWRMTTDFTGDATPILNWEEADTAGAAGVGDAMTESSGIFTFPNTGIWEIIFVYQGRSSGTALYNYADIMTTVDDSSYILATRTSNAQSGGSADECSVSHFIFDVTDTTQCKVRFDIDVATAGNTTQGDSDHSLTHVVFKQLGTT